MPSLHPDHALAAPTGAGQGAATVSMPLNLSHQRQVRPLTPDSPMSVPLARPTAVRLVGNTFQHKDEIKQHGGAWNRDLKAWVIPAERVAQEHDFLERIQKRGVSLLPDEPPQPTATVKPQPAAEMAAQRPPLTPAEREKVIERARKLMALGQSDNEFESEQAHASAIQILERHGLSLADAMRTSPPPTSFQAAFDPFQGLFDHLKATHRPR